VGFGWVQAHPESFLAKLADNEDDGVMEEKADTIRLDRDPTLFAHVLKLLDKPLEAVDTEALCKELDFYGLLPSSTMLPAAMLADKVARAADSVVSSIVDQMAVLINEKLSDMDGIMRVGNQLTFCLIKPNNRWSEVKVRLFKKQLLDKPVRTLPPHIQQPLETRLRSLGYGVKTHKCQAKWNELKCSRSCRTREQHDRQQITVSWAK
jgi:hypothetical protein